MKKDKKNLFILIIVIICVIVLSYLLFFSGITNKLKASLNGLTASINENANQGDLPIINNVINSSGEVLVNTDVAIIINASSIYNITKVEYSFDLKNWKKIDGSYNTKNVNVKLVFKDDMDKILYIRATNEKGYQSYAYKTAIKIDKTSPKIIIGKYKNDTTIKASDLNKVSSIQYSSDKLNWEDINVSGEEVTITKTFDKGTYLRAVDSAGNISKIKEVK